MRNWLFTSVCLSLLALASPVTIAKDVDDPGPIVMNTIKGVLAVLGDAKVAEADKRGKVYALVRERMDFEGMSRRVLAMSWKDMNAQQRAQFQDLFSQLVLGTYWEKIRKYKGEKVNYVTSMVEGEADATVDTIIVSGQAEIPITYRMEMVNGKWLAYDVLVESLSLVASYKEEYRNVINSKGVDGLLARLQAMVKELNSG